MKALLRQVPLFAALPGDEIVRLAAMLRPVHFTAGTVLLREGHTDDCVYVVVEGQAEVVKALGSADQRVVAVRGAGACFGEMSLFTKEGSHSASVRALTEVSALEMTRGELDALVHRQPVLAYELGRTLTEYLDESENATILDLREKNRQLTVAYEDLKAAQAQIVEKEKLEHELHIARDIQRSILPADLPLQQGYDFGALMIPARAVGGDFYDFIPLGQDRWGIVVGDVSDKGIPAALFMMLTYSLVRALAGSQTAPGDLLRAVNQHLIEINQSSMFVTILYGILDCDACSFTYARAAQPYPLVLDGVARPISIARNPGTPLGIWPDSKIDEQCVSIPPGGTLLIFSDGLSEALDEEGDGLALEQACAAALNAAPIDSSGASAQRVCERLWHAVALTPETQRDDFVVVALRRIATAN